MSDAGRKAASILLAALIIVGFAGFQGAKLVEGAARARAASALSAEDWPWARVEADGLRLTLAGEAPGEAARAKALALLAQAAGAPHPLGAVILDGTTPAPASPAGAKENGADITIMRGEGALTIVGEAPGAAQAALAAAFADIAPELAFDDFSRKAAAGASEDWATIADAAARIAAALSHGQVEMAAGRLSFSGIVDGAAARSRIDAAAASAEAAGWEVRSALTPAPAPAASFVIQAETGRGAAGMTACAASDADEAERLAALAAPLGGAPVSCEIGSGAPPGWAEAAEAALAALAALPAGEVSVIGRHVRLTAKGPSDRRAFQDAAARLKRALPSAYRFSSFAIDLAEADPPRAASPKAGAGGEADIALIVSFDGARLKLAGDAPDSLTGESLATYARAIAPGDSIETDLTYGGEFPPGWRGAAMAMIAALTQLERGEGRLDARTALIEGAVRDPLAIAAVQKRLAEGVGAVITPRTRIRVSPERLAAAEPLPASRCARELTRAAAEDPIGFAPGSAEIDASSAPTIARLAATLGRCAGGRIEIAGHTDAQGSEAGNLRLSRARAEAVLEALLAAGARLNMLSAAGYGEAEPIADNGTEEGRARNRRIEFRNLATDEAQ